MIDYNKLLDDWADHLLPKAHEADEKSGYEQAGSYKYGYFKGYSQGIREASAYLSFLEKRKSHLYKMEDDTMDSIKNKVYEVDFEGCTPYSNYIEGYYAIDGIIYNEKDEVVSEDEIKIRNLEIECS